MRHASILAVVLTLSAVASVSPQEPVISRSAPMTLTGEIVDISCYKQKGVAAGTGAAHVECAKMCVCSKRAPRSAILSDGDGLFRLWGTMARDKYAKLMPLRRADRGDHGHRGHAVQQLRRALVRRADDQGGEESRMTR